MPGGDRTGPLGQGPMTGRGAGYCGGFGRGRQHAAAPILHGLEVFLPQLNISNKRVPAPQGGRRRQTLYFVGFF